MRILDENSMMETPKILKKNLEILQKIVKKC